MSAPKIVNVDQASGWDGPEGDFWVEYEDRFNGTMRRHFERMRTMAAVSAGERVLDIGCGCGESTREAARAAQPGSALGVDLSAAMLQRARDRSQAEGLVNARFEQADAQVHRFEEAAFDVVISRFGSMFFSDPVAAFRNIRRALRPGGRLVLLVWRELIHNEWVQQFRAALAAGRTLPEPPRGAPGPFGLADADFARGVLSSAGFARIIFTEINEPLVYGKDREDAFTFLQQMPMVMNLLNDLDPTARERALEDFRAALAAHETARGVEFQSSAWVITARSAAK